MPPTSTSPRGYVLEEHAIEGTARGVFQLLEDPGRSPAEYARAPYRTRLLVLRPER